MVDQDVMMAGVHDGAPNEQTMRRKTRLHLTMMRGHRMATVAASDYSEAGIKTLVARGMAIVAITAEDEFVGLPDPQDYATHFPDLQLDQPVAMNLQDAVAQAKRMEEAALMADRRIAQTERATVSFSRTRQCYANSDGFLRSEASTLHSLMCQAVAIKNDQKEVGFWWDSVRCASDLSSPEEVGRLASERTLQRLGTRTVSTQTVPVLFEPLAAAEILGNLLDAISARPLYQNASFLAGRLDDLLFPEHLNILDDPLMKRGLASRTFDSDGIGLRSRWLVQEGRLRSYCLGLYGSRRMGLPLSRHQSGPSNLVVSSQATRSSDDFGGMLQRLDRGLLVTGLMGGGSNTVTGDFSAAVQGFWVKDGEIVHPVAGVTVASHLATMCAGLLTVGNDILTRKGMTTGSWLIEAMRIGGI